MKLVNQNPGIGERQLIQAIAARGVCAPMTEPFIRGGYLEVWFRCLQLSKQYTQNCRTGNFLSDGAFDTYQLFGSVEDFSMKQWWHERGCQNFGQSMTTLRVRHVVAHKKRASYGINVDAYPETSAELASQEFSFWLEQIRMLNGQGCLLSNAPLAWSIYKGRISPEAIKFHLDVLEAKETIIRNSPETRLWRIGEQMRLNPKAMTKSRDSKQERVDKHVAMGKTVSAIVRKSQALVNNACEGIFPKF